MNFKILKSFAGPARYDFKDPDTGHYYRANSLKDLVTLVLNYREQNELPPIEHLDMVLNNYWCGCAENMINCQQVTLKRGVSGYLKGGVALLKTMLFKKFVTQEEADKRASICVSCPLNIFPDKKGFLKWSDEIAEQSVEDRRSIHHDRLGNCEVCSCVLKAKVFYGGKITLPKDQYDRLPNYCWQRKEGTPERKK